MSLKTTSISSNIADYKDSTWGNRSLVDNKGEINASIKTETGRTISSNIKFISEDKKWKISAISFTSAGLNSSNIIPSEEDQVQLVVDSMKAYDE